MLLSWWTDYNPPVSAADVVHAVTALLTCPKAALDDDGHGGAGSGSATAGSGDGGDGGATAAASGLAVARTAWRANFDEAYNSLARWVCMVSQLRRCDAMP